MSRLTRKHNNLRKAQARFEKVSRRGKQFQLQFDRQQSRCGNYRTSVNIVRGEKQYHGNNRGILHKIVNLKYRVNGDTPSITRTINAIQPTTFIGKSIKKTAQATNFVVHDTVKTAVDAGLTAETVGIKVTDTASREIVNKARQKYTREAVDDYHRGTFATLKIGADAVKGTHKHFKLKKQYRLEKAKYRLKKAENDIFKAENFKPNKRKILRKLIDNKEELQLNKSKFKNSDKANLDRAFYIRRKQKFKQNKRELNQELNKLKSEKKFRNLALANQKKIAKNSNPGLLITKPVKYTGNRMKASAWQKAVNEDQDNDVLHAIDSTKRRIVTPVVQKVSKPERLQRNQKKRDKISDKNFKSKEKLRKKDNRLKEKHDNPKKKKKAQNTDRIVMHEEPCKCGNTRPWLTIEGRTDDILCFENGVRIAPMLLYAILKEVHGIDRFQLIQHNDNRLELRLIADNKQEIFISAKKAVEDYLDKNGVLAEVYLSDEHLRHTLSAESISILLQRSKN